MYELHKYKVEISIEERNKELKVVNSYRSSLIKEIKKEVKDGNLDNNTADILIRGDTYKTPRIITSYDKYLVRLNNDIKHTIVEENKIIKRLKELEKLKVNKDLFNFVIKLQNKSFINNVINNE